GEESMFAHPSRRRFFHLAASAALTLRSSSSWCEESAGKKPANGKSSATPAKGPLRLHPKNPRYFTDGSGKAVYLTGAHTWYNLQDIGLSDPPPSFNFDAHLAFLQKHHHNFMRLWRWELARWTESRDKRVENAVHSSFSRPGSALPETQGLKHATYTPNRPTSGIPSGGRHRIA